MYQLILFNVLQNAVKYNQYFGDIVIKLNIKDLEASQNREKQNQYIEDCNAVLETEIIDTGIGIEKERQHFLFVPFAELKQCQDLKQVKDSNIGMGLACSLAIVKNMGGDIVLKES